MAINIDQIEDLDKLSIKELTPLFEYFLKSEQFKKYLTKVKKKIVSIPAKSHPSHTPCKEFFLQFYKNNKPNEFYWTPKEAASLNKLLQKIEYLLGAKKTEKKVLEAFKRLLIKIPDVDPFVYRELSISLINSRFNEIISKIRQHGNYKMVKVRPMDGGKVIYISLDDYKAKKHFYKIVP